MIKFNFSIANKIKCSSVNFSVFLVILSLKMFGQLTQDTTQSYISHYANEAVKQMFEHKIPASVILAQAIFESDCGNSQLAKRSNNHFGIKCHTKWDGDTIRQSDDSLNECFRRYSKVEESYRDHSIFLKTRTRYKHLFSLPISDYKSWCYGLKKSGYATYTYYSEVLIKIIEQYHLYEFDQTEQLKGVTLMCSKTNNLRESKYTTIGFTLKEFSQNDVLWTDVKYLLIQSLDLVIDHPEKEIELIAENY
ncbi:MAG: glucosaminidase domain-containing protein [Bacteroidota bacterium]|nr:glucosaminidase domain-containing protein [Bacteroidota bacterium]